MVAKTCKIDNPAAVIGALAKELHGKYGDEVLDVIAPILREYGFQSGHRLMKKLADRVFADRVEAWLEPIIRTGLCEVIEKGPAHIAIRGTDCPLNLEETTGALCDACMCIDEGLVSALAEKDITLRIERSMARGDDACLVRFSI
ncbi:MAG: hypothetical protein D4R84_12655 [Rhodocyclaceae bacterium]|nr:MAG: hypothetical protein D4R84_12655 [Rhodocyclaceae bacterium]